MKALLPSSLFALCLLVGACTRRDSATSSGQAGVTGGTSPTTNAHALADTAYTECLPVDNPPPGSLECKNMLPLEASDGDDESDEIKDLAKFVRGLKPVNNGTHEVREALFSCRNHSNNDDKAFDVTYNAPEAMQNFPSGGTLGRDLVVAVFSADLDERCPEAAYGVRDKRSESSKKKWTRYVQFITVNTSKATPVNPQNTRPDSVIGSWLAWSISVKKLGMPGEEFRLDPVRMHGSYKLCGKPHKDDSIAIAFLNCRDHRVLAEIVEEHRIPGVTTMGEALTLYAKRDTSIFRFLDRAPRLASRAAAWGRCGNLGCCAAE